MRPVALILCCLVLCAAAVPGTAAAAGAAKTNNWAVILSSSRFFFNLRHTANALSIYHLCRKYGMDDDHILMLLSDSHACDPRNPEPATIYSALSGRDRVNLYGCSVQVDYAGYDVDVRRFLGLMQGRYDEHTPPSRRLQTDENSNLLIYMAGHAAEGFFKFQDAEFLTARDMAETFSMMWEQRRYRKVVFLVDTCRALAMCEQIRAPNVVCLASSTASKESYSHHLDPSTGLTVISRWTYESLAMLEHAQCNATGLGGEGTALQMSWYDFNYGEERAATATPSTVSVPAHFDAVNDPNALREWKLEEFFCEKPSDTVPVDVRYDLL